MSGPSDRAVEAAWKELFGGRFLTRTADEENRRKAARVLDAAHSPALGLDRSVCLRDVVEALEGWIGGHAHIFELPEHRDLERVADFIEREFGEGSGSG